METSRQSPSPLSEVPPYQNGYSNGHLNGHSSKNNGHAPALQMIRLSPWGYPNQEEDSDFDLIGLLNVLRRRAFAFVGVTAVVTFGVWTRTLMETPIYEGSFRILVEAVSSDPPISELIEQDRSELDYATQIQVLKSPETLQLILEKIQTESPEINLNSLDSNLIITRLNDTKIPSTTWPSFETTRYFTLNKPFPVIPTGAAMLAPFTTVPPETSAP